MKETSSDATITWNHLLRAQHKGSKHTNYLRIRGVILRLQPTQAHEWFHGVAWAGRIWGSHGLDRSDVLWTGAAAATDGVDQVLLAEGTDLLSHFSVLMVVAAHGIGEASVGVAENKAVSALGQVVDVLLHVGGAQSTVKADGKGLGVADAVPEGLVGLTAQLQRIKEEDQV